MARRRLSVFLESEDDDMKVEIPVFRTGYNYDREAASDESGIACPEASLAQQQFREDADINVIVKRFNLTGELPAGLSVPQYGDFSQVTDYHSAMNLVRAADAAFMELPAHIRARFNHDAGAFVDFVSDDRNRAEAEALGIVVPPLPPADAGGPASAGGAAPGGEAVKAEGGGAAP